MNLPVRQAGMRNEPYERALQKDNLRATSHLAHTHFS